jgi:hypothetical protein
LTNEDLGTWCQAKPDDYRPHAKTVNLWVSILQAVDDIGTPMTIRQMFYALVSRGVLEKTEQGYDQVGYHLLKMRRYGAILYSFIADNTRWMRKQRSYGLLREFLIASQALDRKSLKTCR